MAGHGNINGNFPSVTAFFCGSSWVPSPKTACSLYSQFGSKENMPRPKTTCLKEFHLCLLPRLQTEVTILCCCQKVYASRTFCMCFLLVPHNSENSPKSPLRGSNAIHFRKQNNNSGSLLNCKKTMMDHFTEMPLSR